MSDKDTDHYISQNIPRDDEIKTNFTDEYRLNTIDESQITLLNQVIRVVICEIESWDLSGLSQNVLTQLKIPFRSQDPDEICKEEFEQLVLKNNRNKTIDEMLALIIENYDIDVALENSKSFETAYNQMKQMVSN